MTFQNGELHCGIDIDFSIWNLYSLFIRQFHTSNQTITTQATARGLLFYFKNKEVNSILLPYVNFNCENLQKPSKVFAQQLRFKIVIVRNRDTVNTKAILFLDEVNSFSIHEVNSRGVSRTL